MVIPGSVPFPRLSPFPHRDAPLIAASEGDDLEESIVVEVGEREAVDHRQPSRRQAAGLHEAPTSPSVAPEPIETIPVADASGIVSPGDDIDVSVSIDIPERGPGRGGVQDLQPGGRGLPASAAVSQIDAGPLRLVPAEDGPVADKLGM